jgi:hypothetical protein
MRINNWPKQLIAAINDAQKKPFVWGAHDCCLFASDCAKAITGVDAAGLWRGSYVSEEEAAALIASAGGLVSLVTSACSAAGWKSCEPSQARRGDIVCFLENGKHALGVCVGSHCAFLSFGGVTFRPLSQCISAWRVD